MKYWKDETEPVRAFVRLWETLLQTPEFIDGMKKVNQLGMDTISAGATIAWAVEAFEKGDLTPGQRRAASP